MERPWEPDLGRSLWIHKAIHIYKMEYCSVRRNEPAADADTHNNMSKSQKKIHAKEK